MLPPGCEEEEEEGGDKDGVERGLEGPGRVEEYVYAHPGCLKCKERERVVRMRVACERRKRKERARVMWEKRRREVEELGGWMRDVGGRGG